MKIINTILAGTLAFGLCFAASAEMRTWTFKTGETLEAELVKIQFDKIVLKDADGKEWTIDKVQFEFSDEDQELLALESPPTLKLEFRKSIVRKNFSMVRGAEDRLPEQRANFGAEVKQTSSTDYPYELTIEFFAIGKELKGSRFIVLDRYSQTFTLTKENKREFKFESPRTINLTDLWPNNSTYSRRGEQYDGFLVMVKDKRGKIIAMDASRDFLVEHLSTLEERGIGNYMDDTCKRTFPTRPDSYIASNAAGRT